MEESFLFFATSRQVAYMHSTLTDCQCGFDVWKTGTSGRIDGKRGTAVESRAAL